MKKIIFLIILIVCVCLLFFYFANKDSAFVNYEKCEVYRHNHWKEQFNKYFAENDVKQKVKNLKKGMDIISIKYIDKYMENSKFWNECVNQKKNYKEDNLWTKYDHKLLESMKGASLSKLFGQICYEEDFNYNVFIDFYKYGLKDLPKDVLDKINGKDILDIGAWPGDTSLMFHELFPKSNIYAYEAIKKNLDVIIKMMNRLEKEDSTLKELIHPIPKGAGSHKHTVDMEFLNRDTQAQIVRLDDDYPKIGGNNLGLIKMDIEGDESPAIKGCEELIKKYKPVLVIAIYHTPDDFFEMKDKLQQLNPDYKFMIRRSENILADADLVLIAY